MEDITLKITNGTDREIRFELRINDESKGELMMTREQMTKLADLLFGRDYTIYQPKVTLKQHE